MPQQLELLSRMVKDGALSYLGNDNYETRDSSQVRIALHTRI
jgi:hypothetical protein